MVAGAVLTVTRNLFAKTASAKTVSNSASFDAIDAYVEGQVHRLHMPGVSLAIDLRRARLLESRRGAQGGYLLARAPRATTVGGVIRALGGAILPVRCVAEQWCSPCNREDTCAARGMWERVRDRLVETLDSLTLAGMQ